jgi:polyisoprenoid-binding protein YceI
MFGANGSQATQEFRVDPAASTVTAHVRRGGLFGFAGHDHEVAVPNVQGRILLDPTEMTRSSVTLQFDATAMKVTGQGEPAADVPEVQRVMLSERVLDAQRFPTITFASRRVSVLERSADRLVLRIEGDLTLRGTTRPVALSVEVRMSPDRLTATGKTTVRQTDFGIRPVTAGAGTVRVKDEVELAYSVVARQP